MKTTDCARVAEMLLEARATRRWLDALPDGAQPASETEAYQPVDKVLVQSERRSKRMFTTIRAGMEPWATRTMRMASSAAPSVVGIVTLHPRKPKTGSPCRALGRFSAVTGRST